MTRSRAGALAVLLAVAVAGPARAQVDTEEERQREEERERRVEKSMPAWRYEFLRRERDRSRLKGKTELDRLVESARLFSLVGKDPPPFTLPRADGARVGLSDFTREVVMLYFWSTASTYASAELASTIHKLQRELQASHFTVLAVDTREKPEDVAAWMKGRAFSPVLLLDTDGGVTDIYKVRAIPTIYLIGRDHKLVGRAVGTRSWEEGPTRALLDYLLKAPIR